MKTITRSGIWGGAIGGFLGALVVVQFDWSVLFAGILGGIVGAVVGLLMNRQLN